MDKLEYIQGDLVKFATNTYTIVNFEENFLHSKICYALISTNSTKTTLVSDRYILPIPLTTEILEKNGWENDGYDWYRLPTKRAYLYITKDITTLGEFLVCVGLDRHNLASINFVHQLQHLLFGLGINHEMEV